MKLEFRYTGERDSKKKQNIAECIEYVLSKQRGDTIATETLAKILGYNTDDEKEYRKFKSTMLRVKNFLIDYGYVIKSIAGVGYYILKSKQISGYCYHTYILKTERLLEKSDRILTHTDQTELNEVRKEEYKNVNKLNQDVYENIDDTINASEHFKNKNKYDSLED